MRPRFPLLTHLLLGALMLAAAPASAQQTAVNRTSSYGLDGLDRTAWPAPAPNFAVAGTAGYGMTESVPGAGGGSHHRLTGTLGAGVTLPRKASWLSLALRFDGRLDFHPEDTTGPSYGTGVGDPRLVLRGGYQVTDTVQVGADAILWVPGEAAPSVDFGATTADLRVLTAYEPESVPLAVLGFAGFRLDNSAKAAPDLTRLRGGDRLVLGVSDFDAVLVGVGLAYDVTETVQVFGEVSGDVLVGSGAPPLGQSPWRASLGARYPLLWFMVGEIKASASLSKRPGIEPTDPLVPVEPRFSVELGLRFGKSLAPPPPPEAAPETQPEPEPEPEQPVVVAVPETSSVSGQILDNTGEPLPDTLVTLERPDGTKLEAFSDAEGRFVFEKVPLGEATLHVSAALFDEQDVPIVVGAEPYVEPPRKLERHEPQGTLRGLARSFASEPLKATIRVLNRRGRLVANVKADAEGRFELPLKPGTFKVRISAPGYTSQRRTIQIDDNGVTVLNVDLHERK